MVDEKEMPGAIVSYLRAQNEFNVDTLVDSFLPDAVIVDEGNTYKGHKAIRKWNIDTNAKYQTQMLPLKISSNNDVFLLKIQMSGTFPGSPVEAAFCFEINAGKIAALHIH